MDKDTTLIKYIYNKYKDQPVPYGTTGKVLRYVEHPVTTKILVDFGDYGKAIIPVSAAEQI